MSLSVGQRLGPYEVLAPIGKGGMGEVYRARDTKLNRDVAIKVLPEAFALNPDHMARFEREAKVLASLNHPNIAQIYGLAESHDAHGLVMELAEGESPSGPLPFDEAWKIALQIADALEYAHERGIVHRDLKPANVKITPGGVVKLLDFGLAKAFSNTPDTVGGDPTNSPTITLGATMAGTIMGTAAYMAPEQARGKQVDKRADIWSWGVVTCELLTGERMFQGEDVAEVLAAVIHKQPDLDRIPARVRKLIASCLEKDPRKRLRDIGDARKLIEETPAAPAVIEAPRGRVKTMLPWAAAAILLAALIGVAWAWHPRPSPVQAGVVRFTLDPPSGTTITSQRNSSPQQVISPDGRYLVFVASGQGQGMPSLWVRAMGSLTAQRLDRTEGANYPFWSPDSQTIAYFADGALRKIAVSGGSPLTICAAPGGEGGAWNQDGVIVFAPSYPGPLQRVPATGGVPVALTTLAPGETSHSFPQFLPDGRHFLYLIRTNKESTTGLYASALDAPAGSKPAFLMQTALRGAFAPPDLVLFLRESTLLAQHLDLDSLRVSGEAVTVADDVRAQTNNGRSAFSVSGNGILVYRSNGGAAGAVIMNWHTRKGDPDGGALPAGDYSQIELSPDERYLAVTRRDGQGSDLWLLDLKSPDHVFSRLTFGPQDEDPVWSPDSRRLAFLRSENGKYSIHQVAVGSGKETVAWAPQAGAMLEDWTPDGKQWVVRAGTPSSALPVGIIPAPAEGAAAGNVQIQTIFDVPFAKDQFRVSPDGKWVAYSADEPGAPAVFVASFPGFTQRRQVSTGVGMMPLWRRDGKELFFLSLTGGRHIESVEVTESGGSLGTGPIRALFETAVPPSTTALRYAATRDGQRFLVMEPPAAETGAVEPMHVVLNWPALLAK